MGSALFLTSSGGSRKSQISMVAPQLISTMYFTFLWFLKQESALQKVRKSPRMNIYKEQRKVHFKIYRVPPPNLPMCQNPENTKLCKLATPKNGRVQDLPSPKNGRVPNSGEFRGCKSWTLPFFSGGQFGTLFFFLDLWKIWGWQEGSDTLYH